MPWVLVVLLVGPLAAIVACVVVPTAVARALSLVAGSLCFALSLVLVGHPSASALGGWLFSDPLSVTFVVPTAFLYLTTVVFSIGYLHPSGDALARRRYERRFWVGINIFAWTMVMAPLIDGLALLWVAIEITTVVSALLVALDDTPGATEAAWKYVLIASMGLGIALVATIVMYYAGSTVLGGGSELFYPKLIEAAGRFPG